MCDSQTLSETFQDGEEIVVADNIPFSQPKNIYGIIFKKTLDKSLFHLTEEKYGFGTAYHSAYNLPSSQFIVFNKNELSHERYYSRIDNFHFLITRENSKELQPVIIQNCGNKPLYIIKRDIINNASTIHKLENNMQRILRHNDYVSISPYNTGYLFKFQYTHNIRYNLNEVQVINKKYYVGSQLGSGGNAEVLKLFEINFKSELGGFPVFALKAIKKKQELLNAVKKAQDDARLMREVVSMRELNNTHVLRLIEYFDTPDYLFLVLPFMLGGSLINRILKYYPQPWMDEDTARFFFHQLLSGVKYMHSKGFAHRDIKPDNILLSDNGEYPILKIADLGLTKILETQNTICGTNAYSAPEILQHVREYSAKVDLWACGVVLYAMLSGCMPFDESYQKYSGKSLQQQVLEAKINFSHRGFRNVSQSAKFLITSLLQRDENYRWDANLSSAHKWVNNRTTDHLVKQAYIIHNVNSAELIEDEMRRVQLDDPAPKRVRI